MSYIVYFGGLELTFCLLFTRKWVFIAADMAGVKGEGKLFQTRAYVSLSNFLDRDELTFGLPTGVCRTDHLRQKELDSMSFRYFKEI